MIAALDFLLPECVINLHALSVKLMPSAVTGPVINPGTVAADGTTLGVTLTIV